MRPLVKRRTVRRKFFVSLAAAAALLLTGCGGGSDASETSDGKTVLKVQTMSVTAIAALHLGIEKGYFADEGLEIEIQTVPNPAAGVAALQGGQSDLAWVPSIPGLTAVSQGIDLKFLAPGDGYPDDALEGDAALIDDTGLFAAKDSGVASPKDLEGQKVAVPARGAQLEVTIADVIKQDGGDPSKVEWIVLDFPSAIQALNDGRIAAAGLVAPFNAEAAAAGHVLISSPGVAFFEKGAVAIWTTTGKAVEDKSEALDGFARAIIKSNEYANAHLEEAYELAAEVTQVDLELINASAETYWPSSIDPADISRTAGKLAELGFITEAPDTDALMVK